MNISSIKNLKPYVDRKRTQRKKNNVVVKDN